jgi:hypothetical protein
MKIAVVAYRLLVDVVFFDDLLGFLAEAVVDAPQEQQSENVVLVVCGVDAPTEDVCCLPEMRFEGAQIESVPLLGIPEEVLVFRSHTRTLSRYGFRPFWKQPRGLRETCP